MYRYLRCGCERRRWESLGWGRLHSVVSASIRLSTSTGMSLACCYWLINNTRKLHNAPVTTLDTGITGTMHRHECLRDNLRNRFRTDLEDYLLPDNQLYSCTSGMRYCTVPRSYGRDGGYRYCNYRYSTEYHFFKVSHVMESMKYHDDWNQKENFGLQSIRRTSAIDSLGIFF